MNKKISNNDGIKNDSPEFLNKDEGISLSPSFQESTDREQEYKKSSLFRNRLIFMFSAILLIFVFLTNRQQIESVSNTLRSKFRQNSASTSNDIDLPSGNIQPVQVQTIQKVDSYQESRTYTGEIVASRASELGFKRSDQLVRILFDEGDQVKAGTTLAYLDMSSLKAQEKEILAERSQAEAQLREMIAGPLPETINSAKASVKNLSAQLDLAQIKKSRREELYAAGAISLEQLDEAVFEVNSLQARLEEVESQLNELKIGTRPEQIQAQKALISKFNANLNQVKIEQQKSILKAPFSGTIAVRRVDEGTIVTSGQPILRLIENSTIEAHIGVPTTDLRYLPVNSYQRLQIGTKDYSARVSSILPELNSQARTATVVFSLEQPIEAKILLGQIARLKLEKTIASSGYWLPNTALVRRGRGLWSCYTIGEAVSHKKNLFYIQQRDVEVLHSEADRVFVNGTLENGNRVIINGTHRLVPGQLVNILP